MSERYPFAVIKKKLLARRGEVMDFAIGPRSVPLPRKIDAWVRDNVGLALKPSTHEDVDAFTEAAAAFLLREYGVAVPGSCILPAPSGRAAMSAFVACALSPHDRVAVTEPGYPAFARLARHRHAEVIAMPLVPADSFAPDPAPAADAGSLRVIALNYPNNPTGTILSSAISSRLDSIVSAGTILFNDATYGPLVYDGRPVSLLGHDRPSWAESERVELHSFSKHFPLGPIAVSFLAGSETTIDEVSTYSEFAWSPLSKLQLKATMLCLQDASRLDELRAFFPAQLAQLREILMDLGLEPYPVTAGVYLLCRAPATIAGRAVASAGEAAARLMDDFDLAVVPVETPGYGYLRFSALYAADDLDRLSGLRSSLKFR